MFIMLFCSWLTKLKAWFCALDTVSGNLYIAPPRCGQDKLEKKEDQIYTGTYKGFQAEEIAQPLDQNQ